MWYKYRALPQKESFPLIPQNLHLVNGTLIIPHRSLFGAQFDPRRGLIILNPAVYKSQNFLGAGEIAKPVAHWTKTDRSRMESQTYSRGDRGALRVPSRATAENGGSGGALARAEACGQTSSITRSCTY